MATDIIARGMITEYIAGTNINFTENRDGTVEISASGSISSEDSVARDAIGNHKSDTSNPHNVTPAQIGLGNVDNTSDLDKPISTAVQKAIDNKADKTVATTSADGLMSAEDKGKLDAFEITTTGGKLHDKDIAVKDDIPMELPANGGNADTLDGLHASDFMPINGEVRKYGTIRMNGSDGIRTRHIDGNDTEADGALYLNWNSPDAPIYMNGGNTAIHSGNIGSQSVNYANSAGNADTVDGLHANGFIKVNGYDGYDCNTLYDAGLYLCGGTATNTPNNLKYGSLFVMPYRKPYGNEGPDYCAQIFIPNGDASDASMWYRTSLQNTWNEWKRSCDAGNADTLDGLHANEIATNPNLLINPDFKINQRGETDFSVTYHQGTPISQSQKYTVDRWRIMEGRANISNGKYVLNGTIIQMLENSIGSDFTATVSVESGTATASYDDSTKTFSIVGNNAVLNWAKLEYGSNATPFIPPDPATELLRCMRYYEVILGGTDRAFPATLAPSLCAEADILFKVPKRVAPTTIINGIRTVVSTSTNFIISFVAYKIYQTEIYGMAIATVDPIITELPSYLLGVTLDGNFAVDAEIY